MEPEQSYLFAPLVNQTVVKLERVALAGLDGDPEPLVGKNTVLFTLDDGRRFELLDAQDSDMGVLLFKEILTDADLVTSYDLAREGGEFPVIVPLDVPHALLPWNVTNVTEVWSMQPGKPYWRGTTFWCFPQTPLRRSEPQSDLGRGRALLSLFCTGWDGLWIGPIGEWWEHMHFDHALTFKTEYVFYGGYAHWLPASIVLQKSE